MNIGDSFVGPNGKTYTLVSINYVNWPGKETKVQTPEEFAQQKPRIYKMIVAIDTRLLIPHQLGSILGEATVIFSLPDNMPEMFPFLNYIGSLDCVAVFTGVTPEYTPDDILSPEQEQKFEELIALDDIFSYTMEEL